MPDPNRTSRYEVLTRIATGGMATVYVGRLRGAVGFSRLVAIKKPHPFVTADEGLKHQLEHEARIAAMIHHPNVVSVLDVEEIDGEIVLVMDYVEGCTLRDLMDHAESQGRPEDRAVVRILLDVAAGLHAAHRTKDASGTSLGLVHRDVSPHNVLVGRDGVARLTDFGIAKITDAERERTATDVIKGKLAYLAPEYVESRRFDARSDLFALGVIAWESFALARLFKGETTVETLKRILLEDAPKLGTVRPELVPFERLVAQMLARDPEARPASAATFAEELEARAREALGVASHAEVGSLVEAVAGAKTNERRRAIESSSPRLLSEIDRGSARDDVATVSLVAPPAPSSARDLEGSASGEAARGGPSPALRAALAFAFVALAAGGVFFGLRHARGASSAVPSTPSETKSVTTSEASSTTTTAPVDAPPLASVGGTAASDPPVTASGAPTGSDNAPRAAASHAHRPPTAHPATHPTHSTSLVPTHAPPNPYAR